MRCLSPETHIAIRLEKPLVATIPPMHTKAHSLAHLSALVRFDVEIERRSCVVNQLIASLYSATRQKSPTELSSSLLCEWLGESNGCRFLSLIIAYKDRPRSQVPQTQLGKPPISKQLVIPKVQMDSDATILHSCNT